MRVLVTNCDIAVKKDIMRYMPYKILLFMALALFVFAPKAHAQCTNSVCVDAAMIQEAEGVNVDWDPIVTHYNLIDPTLACTTNAPTNTGARTYLWFADGKNGKWINGVDAFCIRDGCHVKAVINGSGYGAPTCG